MTVARAPRVSIGMPVYNGERFLREALESVLAQTFEDFELIISDNASTDGTEEICRWYAGRDSRVRYIRQKQNRGPGANFRCVLDEARGLYFMWAAHDDQRLPEALARFVSVLDSHQDVVLVMSDVKKTSEDGTEVGITRLDNMRLADVNESWPSVRLRFFENPTSQVFFAIYGLFRTSVLRQVSLDYHGRVRYACNSETPILAQLATKGRIASIPEVLTVYRTTAGSVTENEKSGMSYWKELDQLVNVSACLVSIIRHSRMSSVDKHRAFLTVARTGCYQVVRHLLLDFPQVNVRSLLALAGADEATIRNPMLLTKRLDRWIRAHASRLWKRPRYPD